MLIAKPTKELQENCTPISCLNIDGTMLNKASATPVQHHIKISPSEIPRGIQG